HSGFDTAGRMPMVASIRFRLGQAARTAGFEPLRAGAEPRRADQLPGADAGRQHAQETSDWSAQAGSGPHDLASGPIRRLGRIEPTHSAGSERLQVTTAGLAE